MNCRVSKLGRLALPVARCAMIVLMLGLSAWQAFGQGFPVKAAGIRLD